MAANKNHLITIQARAVLEAADGSQGRRFRIDAYSGGTLTVKGFELPIVCDLAGMTADANVIANLDHDPLKRVGHVDAVDNNGQRLILSGPVSAASPMTQDQASA